MNANKNNWMKPARLTALALALVLLPSAAMAQPIASEVYGSIDAHADGNLVASASAALDVNANVAADIEATTTLLATLEAQGTSLVTADAQVVADLAADLGVDARINAAGDLEVASGVIATACQQIGLMAEATGNVQTAAAQAGGYMAVEGTMDELCLTLQNSLDNVSAQASVDVETEAEASNLDFFASIKAKVGAFFSGLF